MPDSKQALPQGYLIDGYRIERVIGGGGFSFVYLAYHIKTKIKVVIKEYFPHDLVKRLPGGRIQATSDQHKTSFQIGFKRFFTEGMALSRLKHPNIVNVSNFFRSNNTVFMVMDFENGKDLRWFFKKARHKIDSDFLSSVFPPILEGLRVLHDNDFLHLDIKPANILLRTTGIPLLLDFGAVQHVKVGTRFRGVQTLTHGFAAPEQYESGIMGPWSDIYSIGMTMRTCITGKPPIPALERLENDRLVHVSKSHSRKHSKGVLAAVDWATTLDHNKRPQNVDVLLHALINGENDLIGQDEFEGWFI